MHLEEICLFNKKATLETRRRKSSRVRFVGDRGQELGKRVRVRQKLVNSKLRVEYQKSL